jgi:uncharacterized membrane protein
LKKLTTKTVVLIGLFAALVAIGTLVIQIPIPKGYIHIGDSLVYLCGIILGPFYGAFAAGIGSMIADFLSGYTIYAPATLIIKAIDAFLAGMIFKAFYRQGQSVGRLTGAYVVAFVAGGIFMIAGYLVYEIFLYGFAQAVAGVPFNLTQAVGGGIVGYPILIAFKKAKLLQPLDLNQIDTHLDHDRK